MKSNKMLIEIRSHKSYSHFYSKVLDFNETLQCATNR